MTFWRQLLLLVCTIALLAGITPQLTSAQAPSTSSAPATATTAQAAPASSEQAYTLPPDKLAKAIALSRIRNILDIAGSSGASCSCGCCWLRAAGPGWSAGRSGFRSGAGFRELVFFAAFFIITALAGLPLDWIGHHYERAYGISVQGWGGWFGDQAKGAGAW